MPMPTAIIPLPDGRVAYALNFKMIADLEPENEAWWLAYGQALERAHREWDGQLRRR